MLLTAYLVDTLSDEVALDGKVSFREAITAANTNQAINEAAGGEADSSDSISFDTSLSGQTIVIRGPQLEIRDDLVIDGAGDSLRVTLDGNGNRRVLAVAFGVTATLRSLQITGGQGGGGYAGGGILNGGRLTLINCRVTKNRSDSYGAGIASDGILVLKGCSVTENTAINYAGIFSSGQLVIEDSTISGNVATSSVGGIYLFRGSLYISNSTVSSNQSKEAGTGVAVGSGTAILRNVTVFGNEATSSAHQLGFEAGIFLGRGAALLLQNSIVAGNIEAGTPNDVHPRGTINAASSNNVIGDAATAGGLVDGENGNIVGADWRRVLDPALKDNGGPTTTHALLRNSVAVDAGVLSAAIDADGNALVFDQRGVGFPRVARAQVDIGAFELADGRPQPGADVFRASEDGELSRNLLTNDSDPDSDPLSVTAVNGDASAVGSTIALASGALLTLNADGSFIYDPNGAFGPLPPGGSELDSFTYTVSDGHGGSATATVLITVFGAGATDLIAYSHGEWQVSVSNGASFDTSIWARWADVDWDTLYQADVNGDGLTDVIGLVDGAWWVGTSDGTKFVTTRWAKWQNRNWQSVVVRDLNGDGQADLLTRLGGNWWAALSTGTAFATPTVWTSWKDASWQVFVDDLDADGKSDLLGFYRGEWWGALSNGNGFDTASRLEKWADVEWDSIGTLDLDSDRQVDVYGLYHGAWFTGQNVGDHFATSLRSQWVDLPWQNVRVGDFNGDSFDDLAAFYAGEWWVTLTSSTGGAGKTSRWAVWKNADWQDIRIGDFDGDGRADLVGRLNGGLWVARSDGERFTTSRWGGWRDEDWKAVGSAEIDGSTAAFARVAQEPELSAFWSSATEDDELAALLLAAS